MTDVNARTFKINKRPEDILVELVQYLLKYKDEMHSPEEQRYALFWRKLDELKNLDRVIYKKVRAAIQWYNCGVGVPGEGCPKKHLILKKFDEACKTETDSGAFWMGLLAHHEHTRLCSYLCCKIGQEYCDYGDCFNPAEQWGAQENILIDEEKRFDEQPHFVYFNNGDLAIEPTDGTATLVLVDVQGREFRVWVFPYFDKVEKLLDLQYPFERRTAERLVEGKVKW